MTDEQAFKFLREMCGYVENSSDTVVKISQDDATREWFVKIGVESKFGRAPRSYYGSSLKAAIQSAVDAGEADKE